MFDNWYDWSLDYNWGGMYYRSFNHHWRNWDNWGGVDSYNRSSFDNRNGMADYACLMMMRNGDWGGNVTGGGGGASQNSEESNLKNIC